MKIKLDNKIINLDELKNIVRKVVVSNHEYNVSFSVKSESVELNVRGIDYTAHVPLDINRIARQFESVANKNKSDWIDYGYCNSALEFAINKIKLERYSKMLNEQKKYNCIPIVLKHLEELEEEKEIEWLAPSTYKYGDYIYFKDNYSDEIAYETLPEDVTEEWLTKNYNLAPGLVFDILDFFKYKDMEVNYISDDYFVVNEIKKIEQYSYDDVLVLLKANRKRGLSYVTFKLKELSEETVEKLRKNNFRVLYNSNTIDVCI